MEPHHYHLLPLNKKRELFSRPRIYIYHNITLPITRRFFIHGEQCIVWTEEIIIEMGHRNMIGTSYIFGLFVPVYKNGRVYFGNYFEFSSKNMTCNYGNSFGNKVDIDISGLFSGNEYDILRKFLINWNRAKPRLSTSPISVVELF